MDDWPVSIPWCDSPLCDTNSIFSQLGSSAIITVVGIASLLVTTAITGDNMLDIVNSWVGGAYY